MEFSQINVTEWRFNLFKEDVVHDDHGREVGVGASHHS